MNTVMRLGYLGFEVSDVDAWEAFGVDLVGWQGERQTPSLLTARTDTQARRLFFHQGSRDDLIFAGWEVADEAVLRDIGRQLTEAGFAVTEGSLAEVQERGVEALVRFTDRAGNPLELFCAPMIASAPCSTPLQSQGFVAGSKGLGHYVAGHPDLAAARALYCDILGMRISDYILIPTPDGGSVRAMFLHCNTRHHSVALVDASLPHKIDHFCLQMQAFQDLGLAHDRFVASRYAIRNSLGQHPNDLGVSFYAATPSRISVEISWSDFELEEAGWTTRTFDRTSLWGHHPPAK